MVDYGSESVLPFGVRADRDAAVERYLPLAVDLYADRVPTVVTTELSVKKPAIHYPRWSTAALKELLVRAHGTGGVFSGDGCSHTIKERRGPKIVSAESGKVARVLANTIAVGSHGVHLLG